MTWGKNLAWFGMTFLAVGVGLYAFGFFTVEQVGDPSFKARFALIPWPAGLHILPGGAALILGAFQFHAGLRERHRAVHRRCGQVYVVCVLVAAVAGLVLAVYTPQAPATKLGFASLAVVWFYTAILAYLAARRRNFVQHRQWMVRCYALTLAAVTLRIQLPLYQGGFGMTFEESYAIVAWFCWVPNLIVAEWLFNAKPAADPVAV